MKNSKTVLYIILIIVILSVSIFVYAQSRNTKNSDLTTQSSEQTSLNQIIFPQGGESLTAGQTYTLKWPAGTGTTQIFLIDTSLKSVGTSVSISDRVYNIENTGMYDYTIPQNLKAGTYEFQIGDITSKTFTVQPSNAATPEKITLAGQYVCLPHKDTTGPQTLECAFGLHAENGLYYALDFSPMTKTPTIETGAHINVTGILTPVENLNTDHWQIYPIKGILSVSNFTRIE